MAAGLAPLRGKHDFTAFCAAAGRDRSPTCTMRSARVVARRERLAMLPLRRQLPPPHGPEHRREPGRGGRGARAPGWIGEVVDGRDRKRAGPTAPAQGLLLVRVLYGPEAWPRAGGVDP